MPIKNIDARTLFLLLFRYVIHGLTGFKVGRAGEQVMGTSLGLRGSTFCFDPGRFFQAGQTESCSGTTARMCSSRSILWRNVSAA